jgi:type I restriction-modification system DNA methylase subunit
MALSLNKPKLDNLADQIWKSAQRLRGKLKAYEYQNVILPIIVIRRLECVLIKWREEKKAEIHAKKPKLSDKEVDALVKKLEFFHVDTAGLTKAQQHELAMEQIRARSKRFSQALVLLALTMVLAAAVTTIVAVGKIIADGSGNSQIACAGEPD